MGESTSVDVWVLKYECRGKLRLLRYEFRGAGVGVHVWGSHVGVGRTGVWKVCGYGQQEWMLVNVIYDFSQTNSQVAIGIDVNFFHTF